MTVPEESKQEHRPTALEDMRICLFCNEKFDDVKQCNESGAEFRLDDSEDGASVVLDVKVGKYMDTSLMDVDVQTRLVRVLVKGKMLCLVLPEEVKPDAACARRSKTTGSLVVTMPKARRREKVCSKEEDYVVDGVDGVDGGAGAGGKKKKKGGNPANPGTGTKKLVREMGAVSVRLVAPATPPA